MFSVQGHAMDRHRVARGLMVLAGGLLAVGLLFGRNEPPAAPRNRIPLPIRMLSSALVLAAALVLGAGRDRTARLVAGGMACGLLGDLIMARVIPIPEHVIGGMCAFGVGHGLYMRASTARGRALGLDSPVNGAAGLITGWVLALAGWRALAYSPPAGPLINLAALAYALLLGSMSGLGGALAVQDRRYVRLAAGGALFLLSDLILAGEIFRESYFPHIGDTIWLTYLSGQALIVDSLGNSMASPDATSRHAPM